MLNWDYTYNVVFYYYILKLIATRQSKGHDLYHLILMTFRRLHDIQYPPGIVELVNVSLRPLLYFTGF